VGSDGPEGFNPFDAALDAFKKARDSGLEAWAKAMIGWVNTEAYAKSTGAMLDWYLTATAPVRQVLQKTVEQTLTQFNLPIRGDITNLAERLTHIEMVLDDIAAKLESPPAKVRPAASPKRSSSPRVAKEN
jgi:hypothetical protein